MESNYNKFLLILKKWPTFPVKEIDDYGSHLRKLIKQRSLNKPVFSDISAEENAKINSLLRLSENKYSKMYPENYKQGASGFKKGEISAVLIRLLKRQKEKEEE